MCGLHLGIQGLGGLQELHFRSSASHLWGVHVMVYCAGKIYFRAYGSNFQLDGKGKLQLLV